MSKCPRCFHDNPANVPSCELCGASLTKTADTTPAKKITSADPTSILAALTQDETDTSSSQGSESLMSMRSNEVDAGMRVVLQNNQDPVVGGGGRGAGAMSLTAMGSGYRLCPQCTAANALTAIACVQCGASLESRAAPKPGKKVESGMELIAVQEDGTEGRRIPLDQENSVVGRSGDIAYPNDAFLSPHHALLHIDGTTLYAEDLNSLNGTYLKIREEIVLHPGDVFLMGRQVLRVQRFENEYAVRSRAADGTRYMGSPLPSGRLKIEQIGLGGMVQDVHCLSSEGALIGREKGDVLFSHDKFMSSRHAQIRLDDDGEFYLADQNSSNGSWLRIQKRRALVDGDFLFLGQQLFRVSIPK